MDLLDVAEEPLIFRPDEVLSKVASKMYELRKYEALVFKDNKYLGVIAARDLIKKSTGDPNRTKLANLKSVIQRLTPFEPTAGFTDVVGSVLVNNYRSIPVGDDNGLFVLTKLGLLKLMPKEALRGKTAKDVMVFPPTLTAGDSISVAKSLFKQSHVYRLAVVSKAGKVEGIIDALDMLKFFIDKERSHDLREGSGEKINLGSISASSRIFVHDMERVLPDTAIAQVANIMINKNQETVVVEDRGKFLGLITPRDILRLVGKPVSGIYINISGMHDEDDFIKTIVDEEIRTELTKLGKVVNVHYLTMNVKKYGQGRRVKYAVHGKLVANKGMFFSEGVAWDLTKATKLALKKIEREVLKKTGKEENAAHGRYSIGKRGA